MVRPSTLTWEIAFQGVKNIKNLTFRGGICKNQKWVKVFSHFSLVDGKCPEDDILKLNLKDRIIANYFSVSGTANHRD